MLQEKLENFQIQFQNGFDWAADSSLRRWCGLCFVAELLCILNTSTFP